MHSIDERVVKIARRVHQKYNLDLPVPVSTLIKEHADLIEVDFPFHVDGLCVDLKIPGKRPKVFVKPGGHKRRKLFTLAHELGHILIPWHAGNIIDHVDDPDGDADFHYWIMEKEANAFASELLMPPIIVNNIIEASNDAEEIVSEIREACGVSTISAAYRAIKLMPKNNVICFSFDGEKYKCVRSPETKVHAAFGDSLASIDVGEVPNGERSEFSIGSYSFIHWYFPEKLQLPAITKVEWREALKECLECYIDNDADTAKAKQRLNGIISFINSSMRKSSNEEELYAEFIHRISGDDNFSYMLDNPLFHEFAALRIRDFLSRR